MARNLTPAAAKKIPEEAVESYVNKTVTSASAALAPTQDKPTTQIIIRLTEDEKRQIDEAAQRYAQVLGVPVSKQVFLRRHLMEAVAEVLRS